MRIDPRERGAALLTVLMLVAVIAVMAGGALEKLRLSTRLASNAASGEQARAYAVAAEAMAVVRVGDLMAGSPKRITLAGGWSGRPFGLPLPGGGLATARVSDGGNCFNLNGLVTQVAPGVYSSGDITQRVRFTRLMGLIGIPQQVAQQVAGGAADWIDTDQDQQAGGAEDARYTGYRTAGTLMADPSELRAVAGVTPEIYAALRPWVCALPTTEAAKINVNTLLPEQAPLLAMVGPDTLSVDAARALLMRRPPQGYGDANAVFGGLANAGSQDTAVTSTWFDLRIDVSVPGATLEERALIDATRLPVRLVSRQWGEDI
ncbi:type II secretion system minor pseudopilin GspK [Microvirga sp. SRT01]|uniref:Type II secretion system protein K n=1 Tax=Sphingomonas longa TaxID=2778730 RepID=A0ABS2DE79_9SPHN|nr:MULTISPECIES: type II secretion system minor pseudopilin GspK [Alphaproteobacteria]MBM6578369.1 type II secretion system minor pseudopilin GspK [Sphingomonas sp. BT552]MBR7711410.1 type II secretion system minor pseudopilin GspK [Microvirga sp. SRT01]